jgi:hypothetical protein
VQVPAAQWSGSRGLTRPATAWGGGQHANSPDSMQRQYWSGTPCAGHVATTRWRWRGVVWKWDEVMIGIGGGVQGCLQCQLKGRLELTNGPN